MDFRRLCEPGQIGNVTIRNRIVMAPMGVPLCTPEGFVGERQRKYFEERARGGAGLIITGLGAVDPEHVLAGGYIGMHSDKFVAGLHELVNAVHVYGAKIFIMIWHPGRQNDSQNQPVAPSPIACRSFMYGDRQVPRELTTGEVEGLVEKFGEGARRAKEAGADGLAIHATHGYLIHQFLSPFTNVRADKYGGSFDNRNRFLVEIIRAAKERIGPDFPIYVRIGQDFMEPGNKAPEVKLIAQLLEKEGVSCLGASGGMHEATRQKLYGGTTSATGVPPGWELEDAQTVKSAVNIPVMAVGGLGVDLDLAEKVLREGTADFIEMGRPLIADPDLPMKVMTGKTEEIRWCIRCCECHPHDMDKLRKPGLNCSVNPFVGKEADPDWRVFPAAKVKKVLVVGGGPGGMETARVAALRGHDVTLWEKSDKLGGLFNVAAMPPGKAELERPMNYLSHEIKRLGVKVGMGVEATADKVLNFNPEVVILATGSVPGSLNVPGGDGGKVVPVRDIFTGKAKVGQKVVVLGGGAEGSETAVFLAAKGKDVTIVTRRSYEELQKDMGRGKPTRLQKEIYPQHWWIARELPRRYRMLLIKELAATGVKTMWGARPVEVTSKGIVFQTAEGRKELEADVVVLAGGDRPNNALYLQLLSKVPELYVVGDCAAPRKVMDAISDGCYVALHL